MLNKSVLSLMLSFSMIVSPLSSGGGINMASLGGSSARGAASSIVMTDETVPEDDTETVDQTQNSEDLDVPENSDNAASEGDATTPETDNLGSGEAATTPGTENAGSSEGDVSTPGTENVGSPEGDVSTPGTENIGSSEGTVTTPGTENAGSSEGTATTPGTENAGSSEGVATTPGTENVGTQQENVSPKEAEAQVAVQAEGETVYIDENFEDTEKYPTGEVIKSANDKDSAAPDPVDKGGIIWKAGRRDNGTISCSASVVEKDGKRYVFIKEDKYATSSRGISFEFHYPEPAPTVESLKKDSMILELNMDVTTSADFTLLGIGKISKQDDVHVRAVIDVLTEKQYVIITDKDGALISSTIADRTASSFTGAEFYSENTQAQIDNIKVVGKSVSLVTVSVKNGENAIEGADVTIGALTLQTNESGEAVFALPNGSYDVEASKVGFVTAEGDVATGSITVSSAATELTLNMSIDETFVDSIKSLKDLPKMSVTQEEYQTDYKHPETVIATLLTKREVDVPIANNWTSSPAFDPDKKGSYTWTADLVIPEGAMYTNPDALKASYVMEYYPTMTAEHYYYNDFTFSDEVCPSTAWSSSLDQTSGTGYLELSHKSEANGNGYMFASVKDAGGSRGTRIDFSTALYKGAEISFDWLPVTAGPAGKGLGNIDFFSPSNRQNYFTLRFDSDYKITYFTKGDYNNTTVQPEFDGSISEDDKVDTGLGGQNKWFTVKLTFDYFEHTAKLEIAERDDPSKSYTDTVPIEESAKGLSIMVMRLDRTDNSKSTAEMGLDNIVLDYTPFEPDWIVDVKNPADVSVARTQWEQFTFPETVEVTLGDSSSGVNPKIQLPVEQWTAEPAFDSVTSEAGEYVWTGQLVPGELKNMYGYSASFNMTFTSYPFPTYVYNPNTLELSFGQELPEFPKEVTAMMNSGDLESLTVGEWNAIREFNAEEEGIYVYGANIVPVDGKYDVLPDMLSANENITKQMEDNDKYIYDVYYRISYFKDNNDNYNGYKRTMEELDRGVYAVAVNGGVFVSWRLLATEYGNNNISFDIYRNGVKVNKTPITSKTNYVDAAGKAGDEYQVVKIQEGLTYEGSKTIMTSESTKVKASAENYLSIPVQKPDPQPDINGDLSDYTLNDMGVADVDGDGEYEIIVKWYPNDAFDSSGGAPSSPTIFDVYEMDGTPLWRLNLGLEMPSGAHFNQFMLYDLDEDGKAELFIKTSDGTTSYKPNVEGKFDMDDKNTIVAYIGDTSVTPGTNIVSSSSGHVNSGSNEYVTVFNGMTGEEIDTINYVNTTGNFADWGKDDGGNRSARYNIAIAYLPKDKDDPNCTETIPAVLFNRGYYAKTTVIAYTLRNGKIETEWNFVKPTGDPESGKGNHNVSTGDIDKDGFDEIILGAIAIDHDGTVLWVKDGQDGQDFSGHADAIHLAAMNPNSNDLYVFTPNEDKESATMNAAVVNARTGARISGSWFTIKDVGRAVAANITPNPGYEYWSASTGSGIYNIDGSIISETIPVPMNWRMYWDGDLLSELGDGIATDDDWAITKYDWVNNKLDTLAVLEGTKTNNSTKKTPGLTADLFGDWREEVALRNDDSTEIRIYMTTEETDYMIYTLMHDPVYRNAVANQNTSYNQPPHVGFYLGEDNKDTVLAMGLPTAKITYADKGFIYETKEVELTEEIKQVGYNTIEELKTALKNGLKVNIPDKNVVFKEIKVKLRIDENGVVRYENVNADNFPECGVKVVLPYPDGTNKKDYDFVVSHLITMSCNGLEAGKIVNEAVTKTDEGLEMTIMSASPFAIGWNKIEQPADDDEDDSVLNETADNKVAGPAKTGDNMGSLLRLYIMLIAVAAMGITATMYVRYRRKK